MTDIDQLREEYLAADAEAARLSGEYQRALDEQVSAKWQELKAQYRDQINAANEASRAAQKAYCDAEALEALKGRDDARSVAATLVATGGLSQEQVDEALGTEG